MRDSVTRAPQKAGIHVGDIFEPHGFGQDPTTPEGPEEEETVHPTGNASDEVAWSAFIDQIRSRGPNWQRYEKRGEIARGGMGVIQRVYGNDVRRPLAMKVILGKGDAEKTGDTPGVDSRASAPPRESGETVVRASLWYKRARTRLHAQSVSGQGGGDGVRVRA